MKGGSQASPGLTLQCVSMHGCHGLAVWLSLTGWLDQRYRVTLPRAADLPCLWRRPWGRGTCRRQSSRTWPRPSAARQPARWEAEQEGKSEGSGTAGARQVGQRTGSGRVAQLAGSKVAAVCVGVCIYMLHYSLFMVNAHKLKRCCPAGAAAAAATQHDLALLAGLAGDGSTGGGSGGCSACGGGSLQGSSRGGCGRRGWGRGGGQALGVVGNLRSAKAG
jgi:hypothetical protein